MRPQLRRALVGGIGLILIDQMVPDLSLGWQPKGLPAQ
jgi:hypothetical protein